MKTCLIRIPNKDMEEIRAIANKFNIGVGAAYQIWKKKKGFGQDMQWKPC